MPTRNWTATLSLACVGLLAAAPWVSAQEATKVAPTDLVRAVVVNEVAAAKDTNPKFMFRSLRKNQKGAQNRIYVQANETTASMTVSENDQPVSSQKEQAELERLRGLANNPDQLRRRQEHEKQQMEHTLRILKALPDAFCYEYVGTEAGQNGSQLVHLKFKPNPAYSPPSTVEQILQGMNGDLFVDAKARRIARIDGTLFKDVNFGWGIFGRLDKGGTFQVQQADTGGNNWAITAMSLRLTGKILLLKSINLTTDETFQDFRRVPDDLPFARAVEMLESEEVRVAENVNHVRPIQVSSGSR